jgi:antitoxin component YwqK of YwqJK toxin-antitoxin module
LGSSWEQLEGVWLHYNSTGVLTSESRYEGGRLHGVCRYYHATGEPLMVVRCEDGRLVEVISYTDSKGDVLPLGSFKEGNGTVIIYDESGKVLRTDSYVNGLKQPN